MTDESQLQVTRTIDSSLIISKPPSGLIARGRRDAATLAAASILDPLLDTRRLAEAGDAHAQFELGEAYHKGEGVPQDYAEALNWYRNAAEQSHLYAITNLGDMFESGEGVAQDHLEAFHWYRRAADIALLDLERNEGWKWDPDALPYVFQKAAEYGYAKAQFVLGCTSFRARNYAEAVRWYRKAAQQRFTDAQYELGNAYVTGQGVIQDCAEAAKWYREAAAQGHADAQWNLGALVPRAETTG